jgi:allantoinase
MGTPRDLTGYGAHPPDFLWPNGARVAVNFVLNVEEGSEYGFADGDGKTDTALTEVAQARVPQGLRDLAAESMFEFGARVGFWRLARLFQTRDLPLTVFASALALERSPDMAQAIAATDWDVLCHGWRWVEHYLMDETTERDHIARAHASILNSIGRAPEGWYCRYGPSPNTRRLVVEHGGFAYDSDSYADEIPYWVLVDGAAHLIVPYNLASNDAKLVGGPLVTGEAFASYLTDSLDFLIAEGQTRVLSVGLHLRVLGQPGRAAGLARFLDRVAARDDVWVARRGDIARHFRTMVPPPGGAA